MVTTSKLKQKSYKKPIIMKTNPARRFMPYDLAVADDKAAVKRQIELEAYEEKLEADNKVKLQEKADELNAAKDAPKQEDVVEEPPKAEEPKAEEPPKKTAKKKSAKKNPFEKK